MPEPKKTPDFQTEAWYLMRNANYQMRSTFESMKKIIDDQAMNPEERNFKTRELACMWVPDRNE